MLTNCLIFKLLLPFSLNTASKNTFDFHKNFYFRMLTEQDHQLDCALDLMRRLPPHHVERNLSNLIDIVPDLCEDLLSSVDQPLKIQKDKEVCPALIF